MAVAVGGFSIREYASKMRSVDAVKSWPFGKGEGKETKKVEIEGLLPPISCRKYKWWMNELELVRGTHDREKTKILEKETEKPVSGNESGFSLEKEADFEVAKAVLGFDEEKLVMICPVCRSFTAATVNAVNAHIDSCLSQASREERRQLRTATAVKGKSKITKKRSIVEIFAAAPQIETMEVVDEEEEEDIPVDDFDSSKVSKVLDFVDAKCKKKKNRLKDDTLGITSKLKLKNKKMKKKKKKKKKIEGRVVDLSARLGAKREKILKFKLQSPVDFSGQLKGSAGNKRLGKERLDTICVQKKKPSSMKSLSTQNRFKPIRTSKFSSQHQQWEPPVFPVHSILKNQAKVISGMNSSTISNIQVGNQANSRCNQSDRHVRFSGKDGILGPRKKWFSSIELRQVQSLCKAFSDVIAAPSVKDHMTGSDKDLSAMEMNRSDEDVSICTVDGTEHRPTIEKIRFADVHAHVALPIFLSPINSSQEKDKNSSEKSVDLNQTLQNSANFHLFNRGNSTASHNLSYACIPRLLKSTAKEGFNPSVITQAGGNVQRAPSTSRNLADPCGDHIPESNAMSSAENVKAPSQPSSFSLAMNKETNGKHPFLSQSVTQNSHGCALQYQPSCHLSPKDVMSNMCSSAEWKKQGAVLCRGERIDEDFIGLPLNSQGELIQLQSSSKEGFNQLKRQSTTLGSSNNFPTHNLVLPKSKRDHLKLKENHYVERALPIDYVKELIPVQNYLTGNSEVPVSSRLDVTELQSTGRTEVNWQDSLRGNNHPIHLLGSDLNMTNISCYGCRQTQNQTLNGKIQSKENSDLRSLHTNQPTMRLMGKDVTVGRSNKQVQGLEDGNLWTDKEIITEHHPTMTGSDNSLKRYFQHDLIVHPVSGNSKETVTHSLEAQINPASQSFLQMKAAEPRFSHSYLDWQTQVMLQNGPPWISGNPSAKLHPFAHPLPSALLNRTSRFPEPCISDIESLKISSQIPVTASTPHNACQNMLLNSAELNYKQSLPCGATSAFKFPFSQQDCREYVLPSWSQSSSRSLPQWLINAKQQKETPFTYSQPYSDAGAKHHPCTMSGNNFLNIPSPHQASLVSYPYVPSTSHYCMQSSPGPASSIHPSLIPALPGFKPTSSINMSSNRIKVKDRMKSKRFRLKDQDHAKKSKKRPATKASDSKKTLKKPNLEMQGDSSAVMGLNKRLNFNGYTQRNVEASDIDQMRDKGKDVGYYPMEIQKDGLRTSSGIDSLEMDAFARLGPIKLRAGAKHILKPSQNMDQDKSRATHSTIPFCNSAQF